MVQPVKASLFKKQCIILTHNARGDADFNGISGLDSLDQIGDPFCSGFAGTPAGVYHAVAIGAGLICLSGFRKYLFFVLFSVLDNFRFAAFGLRAVVSIF